MKKGSKKFKLGGLHEKHAVATWNLGKTKNGLLSLTTAKEQGKSQTYSSILTNG
jgi:hypothetical protein